MDSEYFPLSIFGLLGVSSHRKCFIEQELLLVILDIKIKLQDLINGDFICEIFSITNYDYLTSSLKEDYFKEMVQMVQLCSILFVWEVCNIFHKPLK